MDSRQPFSTYTQAKRFGAPYKTITLARVRVLRLIATAITCTCSMAQPLMLPTPNQALFEQGREDAFFAPTPGKPWTTGCFGCVRSEGMQMHEGIDIRSVQRDAKGEPTDPVWAVAHGTVVYINTNPGLSTFGRYVVLRHFIDGIEVYSTYAHLRAVRNGLAVGQQLQPGELIGIMGRSSSSPGSISKDRAHLHFELGLLLNEHFAAWFKNAFPEQRNDHGMWNGQNIIGLDPHAIFLLQHKHGSNFNLLDYVRNQTELCRVFVRSTNFPWLRRYPQLIRQNHRAQSEGVAGYEIALNFNGVPFELTPRAASEINARGRFVLLSVNEAELSRNPCRKLVTRHGGKWQLADNGLRLLELLTYQP
ncbi:MAG: M23 family metallopeptidase [Verrucomicrobiae bacterium]|nr:M23 family metallopeptidase [Verrucomicrobiae bacterium]